MTETTVAPVRSRGPRLAAAIITCMIASVVARACSTSSPTSSPSTSSPTSSPTTSSATSSPSISSPSGAGGAWSAAKSIDPGNGLVSVSCLSASFCMAVDGDTNVLSWHS